MKLWMLALMLAPVCVVAVAVCECLSRRHQKLHGPHYVKQVQAWGEAEPRIKPLDLPPVKKLEAKPEPWQERAKRWA